MSNLTVETIKKNIKNIHLGVYPPDGRIRVSAPLKTTDDTIRLFVISKKQWIKKQQSKFSSQKRQIRPDYVTGENHFLFGKKYRLHVITTDNEPRIKKRNKTCLNLYIKFNSTTRQKEAVFEKFYQSELRKLLPRLQKRWQNKLVVHSKEIGIKKMKTKWGSCNPQQKRIWLNLELAKKPLHCIEYVYVHELVHLIEKNHNERFIDILESIMSDWQSRKDELNQGILGYYGWKCKVL